MPDAVPNLSVDSFALTDDERSKLSKVLFPDTHTDEVSILGKVRKVKPLPIKFSKMLKAALDPVSVKLSKTIGITEDSTTGEINTSNLQDVVGDDELIAALRQVAVIVSDFYGWQDVKEAAEKEELTITELQELALRQQEVCGANDFLLGSLRFVINLLKMAEIFHLKFQSMLSMQPQSNLSDAASTILSQTTQKVS